MKTLIAGPWVGEFGWELFAWQAYIRSFSEKFEKTIIISRSNSEALYEDFSDNFIAYDHLNGIPDSFFIPGFDPLACFKKLIEDGIVDKGLMTSDTTLFMPRRIGFPPHTHYEQGVIFGSHLIKPKYISFGHKVESQYDYIFHIRSRQLRKEDNWSIDKWKSLLDLLGDSRVACIGTRHEAETLPGTVDLRDLDLKQLMNVMKSSKCAFGPSSGPMHLASLCGLPHVVWSIPDNKKRYEENWNPLGTPVLFDDSHNWHPSSDYKEWSSKYDIG
jgi:hypothetical protein